MTELQMRAVTAALHTLAVMQVPFAAMLPSGKVGTLDVVPPKAKTAARRGRLFNHVAKWKTNEHLDALAEGAELKFIVPDRAEAASLRSTLVAGAIQRYGNGCCISSLEHKPDGSHVTVLLVTKNQHSL